MTQLPSARSGEAAHPTATTFSVGQLHARTLLFAAVAGELQVSHPVAKHTSVHLHAACSACLRIATVISRTHAPPCKRHAPNADVPGVPGRSCATRRPKEKRTRRFARASSFHVFLTSFPKRSFKTAYFLLTAFFNRAPAANLATRAAGILISAPVAGLRPLRAARLATENVPNPTSATGSPLVSELVTLSMNASKVVSTDALVLPILLAMLSTSSA